MPCEVVDEASRVRDILESRRADLVHIRKPDWTSDQTARLIEEIGEKWWHRLKLHDCFSLLERYPLAGVHLNARNTSAPPEAKSVSCSMHSVEQLGDAKHYDYVTLSPVFDSISKTGYRAAFDLESLPPYLEGRRVVALGGVTPDSIPLLRQLGFSGAAMLGYFWK